MDHFDDHRFENFKMGTPDHSRSHSRNSLPNSTSIKSTNSLEIIPPKRNSHHRRRSSVSTRHESAELMGVSVLELSPSPSRDSFNIGEKDSIRQRALWALEGKPDASYVKVEIPELSTTEIDTQLMFDFPTRPSFPPGTGAGFGPGLASKRDSFKLLSGPLASKDQLGTLVEEEEEESDSENQVIAPAPTPLEPMTPLTPDSPLPQRPRPTGFNLRPLSLTPEALNTAFSSGLPTPGTHAGSSPRPGLKSLSLLVQGHDDITKQPTNPQEVLRSTSPNPRRPMLNLQISSESLASTATCVSTETPSSASDDAKVKGLRRSSISYISSQGSNVAGLPTPEMTPTFSERRYSGQSMSSRSSRSSLSSTLDLSVGNGEEDSPSVHRAAAPSRHRALSASEQHFLFKSHNALLARIQDLEKALSVRKRDSLATGFHDGSSSRPLSTTSDASSSSAEPSDEMFRLVADLKAERDELRRDVEGWRTRVGDLEKQIGVFVKRVDSERREAWVARSRVNLLEVEKTGLTKDMEAKESVIARLTKLVDDLEQHKLDLAAEGEQLKTQVEQLAAEKADVQEEVLRWRKECETLRLYQDESCLATPTPTLASTFQPTGRKLVFELSRNSSGSVTDVEDEFSFRSGHPDETEASDEDDGLAGYEDEEEGDFLSTHDSSSSFDSLTHYPRSATKVPVSSSDVQPLGGFQFPAPTHQSRASLSKTWTFPTQVKNITNTIPPSESIDRFFGCLEDSHSSESSSPVSSDCFTYERSKDIFSNALKNIADDDTPFFFPRGTGSVVPSESSLDVLEEEDEEEDAVDRLPTVDDEDQDMFGEVGGIKITFTPPQDDRPQQIVRSSHLPSPRSEPPVEDDKERIQRFSFGRPAAPAKPSPIVTPPKSVTRVSITSSIPRATNKYSPSSPESAATPSKVYSPDLGRPSAPIVTPPSKRGGVMPSFIPQPVSPPSPARSIQKQVPTRATFIRQPQRKPLAAANGTFAQTQNTLNAEPDMNTRSSPRRSGNPGLSEASYGPCLTTVDLKDGDSVLPSTAPHSPHSRSSLVSTPPTSSSFALFMTSPISSLQSFTNMLPWSPVSRPVENPMQVPRLDAPETRPASLAHTNQERRPLKRRYVSKEVQLERLEARLRREQFPPSKACEKCIDELVFL